MNRVWCFANRRRWRRFRPALDDPARAQLQRLRRYLRENADTAFGREHRFARIDSVDAYRRHVPVRPYDGFEPYVKRIAAGEADVLTQQRVERLVPSSGSTSPCKLIPYTRGLLAEFNNGIGPWVVDLFSHDPDLMRGRAYWSVSPATTLPESLTRRPSAVPIGFDNDAAYVGGALRRLVEHTMAVPNDVARIRSYEKWSAATADYLVQARDLRILSVWHPTFLTLLLDAIEQRHGQADWHQRWPRLGLISCWTDAHARTAADRLQLRLPGVRLQPKGLIATEAFVTLPFADARPVAVCSHFFEFIDERGKAHTLDQLTLGAAYEVVVTTAGGLYRYRLGDRIIVERRLQRTPCLRFVGRADHVSDRRGEKLNAQFVEATLRHLFEQFGVTPQFAMLAPHEDDRGVMGYWLYLQAPAVPAEPLADRLDIMLRENAHYAHCRVLGQLGPAKVRAIASSRDPHAAVLRRYTDAGRRLGDVKPVTLSADSGWERYFA